MAHVVTYRLSDEDPIEDITDNVRLYRLAVTTNAEELSTAMSTMVLDDPDGTLDIVGLKEIKISESTATGSNTTIGSFIVAHRTISRGPYQTGAGRIWTVSLADINSIAEWRVMVGSDANRPAETDVARMQWLMTTSELGQVSDTTFLNTSGPVAMDAVDYRGQRAADIINDCMQASGKNCFIYYREAVLDAALWYDFTDSTAYTSSVRLSNLASDVAGNPLTFAISDDTALERDPSRVYSGAYVRYDGGAAYEQDSTTYNAFRRRDAVVPADNVKSNAKATARALRYLDEMSSEEDRITTAVRLPAAQVNFVREGMRCQFRATHFPGYESFVWARVLQRTVVQDSEEEYLVTLVLSAEPSEVVATGEMLVAIIAMSGVGTPASAPNDLSDIPWTKAFWTGDVADAAQSPGPGGPSAWGIWYRNVVPGESALVLALDDVANTNAAWVYHVSGMGSGAVQVTSANDSLAYSAGVSSTVSSPSAAAASVFIGGFGLQKVNYGQVTLVTTTQGTNLINANTNNETGGVCTVTADAWQPRMWIGYRTGTGVLTVGGTIGCSGASPDYNLFGRGRGGILIPATSFAVVQSAFNNVSTAGELRVTLPSAP